MFIKPKLR